MPISLARLSIPVLYFTTGRLRYYCRFAMDREHFDYTILYRRSIEEHFRLLCRTASPTGADYMR